MTPRRALRLAWITGVAAVLFHVLGFMFTAMMFTLALGLLAGFILGRDGRTDIVQAAAVRVLLERWKNYRVCCPPTRDGDAESTALRHCEGDLRALLPEEEAEW